MGLLEEKIAALRTANLKEPIEGEEPKDVIDIKPEDVVLSEAAPDEIALAKAEVHADAWAGPCEFDYDGAHISVERAETRDGALWVWLRSNVPTSNPYVFVNPPLQTETGKDDPTAAFRAMIGQTVTSWARKQGWRG